MSGGLVGTPIPFYNGFISGPNWPGSFPVAIQMIVLSAHVGFLIGSLINREVISHYGMSTGEALYYTLN